MITRPDILTTTGHYFNFLKPEQSYIEIQDIANALSNICRFNGHTKEFYSVAQHSVCVSHLVPEEYALVGLLHDAAEAYVGDVTYPLKQLIPEYKAIEKRVQDAIFKRFDLPLELPDCIKEADLIMLATEQRDLMAPHSDEWALIKGIKPLEDTLIAFPQEVAKAYFIKRYQSLVPA